MGRAAALGFYAQKQLASSVRLLSWSHTRRYEKAREVVLELAPRSLLDYGCGDGTFLTHVASFVPECVGADIERVVVNCRGRVRRHNIQFETLDEMRRAERSFDVVMCMEVLEHVLESDLGRTLDELRARVKVGGHVVVSVPIEIGVPLLIKQGVRRYVGWRGQAHYAQGEHYSVAELARMVFAGPESSIARPAWGDPLHHGHKGFNWHRLRRELEARFALEAVAASPVPWLGTALNSQVWFTCRRTA